MRPSFRAALFVLIGVLGVAGALMLGWSAYHNWASSQAQSVSAAIDLPGQPVACNAGEDRCTTSDVDVERAAAGIAASLRAQGFPDAVPSCGNEAGGTCTITVSRWFNHAVTVIVFAHLVPGTVDFQASDVSVIRGVS